MFGWDASYLLERFWSTAFHSDVPEWLMANIWVTSIAVGVVTFVMALYILGHMLGLCAMVMSLKYGPRYWRVTRKIERRRWQKEAKDVRY